MSESNGASKQEPSGRDAAGRFLPGVSGNPNGRPRLVHFGGLIEECRAGSLREKLLLVYDKMVAMALDGDVQAMKLLLDKVTEPIAAKLEHGGEVTLRELVREASRLANSPAEDAT